MIFLMIFRHTLLVSYSSHPSYTEQTAAAESEERRNATQFQNGSAAPTPNSLQPSVHEQYFSTTGNFYF
jgi:hypothetical protein